ncbi:MAG: DUF1127 domain-containing protein [Arenicellales bacterium]
MSNYLNTCKQNQPLDYLVDVVPTRNAIKIFLGGTLSATIRIWFQRYQQRQRLTSLSERMLKDIGITREQATQEAEKPFWAK